MNKNIKFRVFDRILNTFSYIFLGDLCSYVKSEEFIIQNYTGILDCDKNEIFEGDILSYNSLQYIVKWSEFKWTLFNPDHNSFYPAVLDLTKDQGSQSKIIRNIFGI